MGILTPSSEIVAAADNTQNYLLGEFRTLHGEIEDEYSRMSIIGAMFLLLTLALLVTASKRLTKRFLATRIQASMLPKDFSADERVDLFATMTPAKEVGGVIHGRGDYKPAKFYCRAKKPRRLENCD